MALTLTTPTNPGTAAWTSSSHVIAAAGTVTFPASTDAVTVTVPAGLESAPVLVSPQNDPSDYNVAGGRTYGTISGTTLTIQLNTSTGDPGFVVAYAVLAPA